MIENSYIRNVKLLSAITKHGAIKGVFGNGGSNDVTAIFVT